MRKIIYGDCNNNAAFLKKLFVQIQMLSDTELIWSISNLDFIPIDKGDFIGGVPSTEMEELLDFQKMILDMHTVVVEHRVFMGMLENIKTVYEGKFAVLVENKQLKIKIFDGDIIEVNGEVEDKLNL